MPTLYGVVDGIAFNREIKGRHPVKNLVIGSKSALLNRLLGCVGKGKFLT